MSRGKRIVFSAKQVEECRKQPRFDTFDDARVALKYVRTVVRPRGYDTDVNHCQICGGIHIVYIPVPHKIKKEQKRKEKVARFGKKKKNQ